MNGGMEWTVIGIRLGLSVLLGGVIGIEREIHGKTAGLRTHMLVALGSALFTVLSYVLPVLVHGEGNSDPTRIAAQIITGVGFLGAGTILQGRGSIQGLTTAASIWLVAAIGMAAGGGFFLGAFLATALGHVVLVVMHHIEVGMIRRRGNREVIRALLTGDANAQWIEELMRSMGMDRYAWRLAREAGGTRLRLEGTFRRGDHERFVQALNQRGSIRSLEVTRK